GVVAGHTTLPVIAIPMKSSVLEGMDALLSSVMMPPGVPVATVGINGAKNAGILAVQMLAISDEELAQKLADEKIKMAEGVRQKDLELQEELKNV
ncbi:MAG: AIR carboxylase family protein, partial [Ruminococcus sp.]|nr:AIR carboxylase family protein [Ruminococcus sp.]